MIKGMHTAVLLLNVLQLYVQMGVRPLPHSYGHGRRQIAPYGNVVWVLVCAHARRYFATFAVKRNLAAN